MLGKRPVDMSGLIRKKHLRENLTAIECPECREYYAHYKDDDLREQLLKVAGRHRHQDLPSERPSDLFDLSLGEGRSPTL